MRFLDLFAGIGGFRLGFDRAGFECAGYVEIDKFARQSYEAIHDTQGEWTANDITKVTDADWRELQGKADIITGGFPCQSFSIAGNRQGFSDTRGTMFFEIARATKQIQPQFLLLENVKGLLNHDKGNTFRTILATLDELGYDAEWEVLNSKDYGVPQNRERVFIVGYLRGSSRPEIFPITRNRCSTAIKMIGDTRTVGRKKMSLTDRVYDSSGLARTLTATDYKRPMKLVVTGLLDVKQSESNNRVYSANGLSPTLTTMGGGGREPKIVQPILTPDRLNKRQNGRRIKDPHEPMFTLTAQDRHGVVIQQRPRDNNHVIIAGMQRNAAKNYNGICPTLTSAMSAGGGHIPVHDYDFQIRKLTPRECWRLQAFPDWAFDRAKDAGLSDTQLYKQAGNAVTSTVVQAIANKLFNSIYDF